jgi:hypothetical protein
MGFLVLQKDISRVGVAPSQSIFTCCVTRYRLCVHSVPQGLTGSRASVGTGRIEIGLGVTELLGRRNPHICMKRQCKGERTLPQSSWADPGGGTLDTWGMGMVQGAARFMYTRGKDLHPLDRKKMHPLLNFHPYLHWASVS